MRISWKQITTVIILPLAAAAMLAIAGCTSVPQTANAAATRKIKVGFFIDRGSTGSGNSSTGTGSSTSTSSQGTGAGSSASTGKEDKKPAGSEDHSDAYNEYMSGETPITELDFSGLKDHDEYAAIETAAIANGDFLPKASSSYDASNFEFNSDGSYRSGFVKTNANAGTASDPGKGTKYEGTSFTGETYIDANGVKHYKSGKGGQLDPAYNNPTQVLKNGKDFAAYIATTDYDAVRDTYPAQIAEFLSRVCTDNGVYQETPEGFWD